MIEAMLGGALIFAAGALTGRFLPARRRGPGPVEPVCGCSHHHGYHDPVTGRCHGRKNQGYWNGMEHFADCTCRRYSGPEPLPEFYAPEIPS